MTANLSSDNFLYIIFYYWCTKFEADTYSDWVEGTQLQDATFDAIAPLIQEICDRFPTKFRELMTHRRAQEGSENNEKRSLRLE